MRASIVLALFLSSATVCSAQEIDPALKGHDLRSLTFGSNSYDARVACGILMDPLGDKFGHLTVRFPPLTVTQLTALNYNSDGPGWYYEASIQIGTIDGLIASGRADTFYNARTVACIVAASQYLAELKADAERVALEKRLLKTDSLFSSRIAKDETVRVLLDKVAELEGRLEKLEGKKP